MQITGHDMMVVPENSYLLDQKYHSEELVERISKSFSVEEEGRFEVTEIFYDTFDWKLYRKKNLLSVFRGRLILRHFDGTVLGSLACSGNRNFFWWDLKDSGLKEILAALVGIRALSPTLNLRRSSRTFRIVNTDVKTVVRFSVERCCCLEREGVKTLPEWLHVTGIRGYDKNYRRLVNTLPAEYLRPLSSPVELIEAAYAVSERQPFDYGGKFDVKLEQNIGVEDALARISLNLVASMEINRPGIIADIDTEFLHDFRIAVRRTRSLLSLLRKALPAARIEPYEHEFIWLGNISGPVRDIDVYLLKKETYRSLVPPSLVDGLDLFFDDLADRRKKELKRLRQYLRSERYRDLTGSWREYLTDHQSQLFIGARNQSCKKLVDSIIKKRFRTFIENGDLIDDDSPDETLHRFRIKGKKIRYLLELFKSFYPPSDIGLFLKQMKRLQDNLGDFNDLSVQIEMLESRLKGLHGENKETIRLAAALGSLISALQKKHRRTREKFNKTYREFRTDENRRLITRMTTGTWAGKGKS